MANEAPKQNPNSGQSSGASQGSAGRNSSGDKQPKISLPKGGGAIKGIEEKFEVNAVTGTAGFSIPLPASPTRQDFAPELVLNYDSGSGNSPFGLGWNVGVPSISRKTEKQLPKYQDEEESDVFLLSGAEDLVPLLKENGGEWIRFQVTISENNTNYTVTRYRPRIEGLFARIERWVNQQNGDTHWRSISPDNVLSLYGVDAASRISDPEDASSVFEWLLSYTCDDKGNLILYQYKQEDFENIEHKVFEKNRIGRCTNTYLKKVFYGNKTPYFRGDNLPEENDFMFQTVLDYGEHDFIAPLQLAQEQHPWISRKDAFSSYRSGFEIRTYRLCQRILHFHCFDELPHSPYLVESMDLHYDRDATDRWSEEERQGFSFLKKVEQFGHKWDEQTQAYRAKSLPPFEFTYQQHEWNTEVKDVPKESIIGAPIGIDNAEYQWIDLYNEGISGILTEQGNGWYYKSNLGDGAFTPPQLVSPKPSFTGLRTGVLQIQDLKGNGQKYLVSQQVEPKGFFELTPDTEWQPFREFEQLPNRPLHDPYAKFIDLNGDGVPELILSEEDLFLWYPAKGEKGYDPAIAVHKATDEEHGPAIVFADATQSIFLSDMNGDGLTDIVRIRNGEICYWANLGYGRFGAKVTMENPPLFDHPEKYNPAYLRLADIDGSGTPDIIYLGQDEFRVWINRNGNSWTAGPKIINPFPKIDIEADVHVLDFLGTGTACIVWSSPLPAEAGRPLRYIDLMGGKKPHLMIEYDNSFGKTTRLHYKSSTHFYLQDKLAGTPWVTKLPFPVHVLSKTIVRDAVSQTRFTMEYSYHHGYYDYEEREFRGFGRVETKDTEFYKHFVSQSEASPSPNQIKDAEFYQPPVLTKTWYHTGSPTPALPTGEGAPSKALRQFEKEYFKNDQFHEYHLPDAKLEFPDNFTLADLSVEEYREALRACKSMPLRSEVYALDGTAKEPFPYTAAETNANIQLLQPKGENRHAVFVVKESESITYHYERNPADPRIAHNLNLQIDDLGNVLKGAAVVYARKNIPNDLPKRVQEEQEKRHLIYTENSYTKDIGSLWDEDSDGKDFRHRELCEVKTYELTGVEPGDKGYFQIDALRQDAIEAHELEYQETKSTGREKRLIEQVRTLFADDQNLDQPLELGLQSRLGLAYESYQLAFTKTLVKNLYEEVVPNESDREKMLEKGQFLRSSDISPFNETGGLWWDHEGTVRYPADPAANFYMADQHCAPYGYCTKITYGEHHLFIEKTEDALHNTTQVLRFNYRTLQPELVRDENDNLTEVAFDTLGMVVGMAVIGKDKNDLAYTPDKGDDLEGFEPDLTPDQINNFFENPITNGRALLGHATSRFVYDFRTAPIKVATINREIHHHAEGGPNSPLQYTFAYSNGLGQTMMQKVQAEPGKAWMINEQGVRTEVDTRDHLRWVGNGRTILNNKGKPVKQYEPYFSTTHEYEDDRQLIEIGVTPIIYYDPLDRVIKTKLPNGTFSKVEFDGWYQKSYDTNDTVLDSKWYLERTAPEGSLVGNAQENEAARKAALHAKTPSIVHLDSLGRAFYTIAHNRIPQFDNTGNIIADSYDDKFLETEVVLDIEGNQRAIIDARKNTVVRYQYDMLGGVCHQENMDRGPRWIFEDVLDKPLIAWKEEDPATGACTTFSTRYDALHRPKKEFILFSNGVEITHEEIEYGEDLFNKQDAKSRNLLGQVHQAWDQVGVITNISYDFKDNLLGQKRQLCSYYPDQPEKYIDWKNVVDLEEEEFITRTQYDALNRVIESITPDGSTTWPHYNEANLLNKVEVKVGFDQSNSAIPMVVRNIDYDAKGQRTLIEYGNDTRTKYQYDPLTYQLTNLYTERRADEQGNTFPLDSSNGQLEPLQDLHYYYDPEGNITTIDDKSKKKLYFKNNGVEAIAHYTYDAIYQLVQAKGRELATANQQATTHVDIPFVTPQPASNARAVRKYRQYYAYDDAGNIEQMRHVANGGSWTRDYFYETNNNRLDRIERGSGANAIQSFEYDHHGSMTNIPGVGKPRWNYDDHIHAVDLDGGGTAYYNYDPEKNRIRKTIQVTNSLRKERLYLGNVEIYRVYEGERMTLERRTLHVTDGNKRIALFEKMTIENNRLTTSVTPLNTRYQFGNHLGSAALELDGQAQIISYEEYHAYGTSAYRYGRSSTEVEEKRYRYSGKERDAETGLYYYGARYYASWLGRWVSCDPTGINGGINLFSFVKNQPIIKIDDFGTTPKTNNNPTLKRAYQRRMFEQKNKQFKGIPKKLLIARRTLFFLKRTKHQIVFHGSFSLENPVSLGSVEKGINSWTRQVLYYQFKLDQLIERDKAKQRELSTGEVSPGRTITTTTREWHWKRSYQIQIAKGGYNLIKATFHAATWIALPFLGFSSAAQTLRLTNLQKTAFWQFGRLSRNYTVYTNHLLAVSFGTTNLALYSRLYLASEIGSFFLGWFDPHPGFSPLDNPYSSFDEIGRVAKQWASRIFNFSLERLQIQ